MSHGNAYIITGIDAIINKGNTQPGFNFKELEREMISGGVITKTKDPQDRFNDELREAASKLGITFGDVSKDKSSSSTGSSTSTRPPRPSHSSADEYHKSSRPSLPNISLDSTGPDESTRWNKSAETSIGDYYTNHQEDEQVDDERRDDHREDHRDDHRDEDRPSHHDDDRHDDYDADRPTYSSMQNRFQTNDRPRFGGDLHSRTREQERRSHIDSIIGSSTIAPSFSFENEKREDIKCMMLADIDSLMSSLADSDVDLTRIPRVDRNSSFEEVESVLKMLRHKNDNARYCSFAEEFLIFGAYALEELFDGKRKWLGRYQPDLTGWHNHVNVKVSRMQHDTSKIVSEVMQDYNIGPGARILLELIPSMVLYSKMRKQQHGEPGIFSDDSMASASSNIRNL
jgi:hypothetical protein